MSRRAQFTGLATSVVFGLIGLSGCIVSMPTHQLPQGYSESYRRYLLEAERAQLVREPIPEDILSDIPAPPRPATTTEEVPPIDGILPPLPIDESQRVVE